MGSARLSRVGDGLLAIADLSCALNSNEIGACPESSFRRDADTRSPRRPLPDLHHAAGRGAGLGRGLGVACGLAVGVGLGVAVGVAVGVGVDGW